jgi:NTE family protein
LYDSHALEKYMREIIGQYGGCNDFNQIGRELHIVATDLDSGKRTIFSRESNQDVPISLAVAASTAVPLLYKPVRIADHDYVDGSVLGNASIDIAIEHGATLVIVINPLVPFDNSNHASIPFFGPYTGYLSEKGLTAVASQSGRVQSHGGLLYHIKQLRKIHPEVDIVLVEPGPNDYQMSFSNVMRYATRLAIVQHGFMTVTLYLAMRFNYYNDLLSRHGIPITERLVEEELAVIQAAENQPDVLRRILENRPANPKQLTTNTATEALGNLDETLNQLDVILRDWPARQARRNAPPIDQHAVDAHTPARSME